MNEEQLHMAAQTEEHHWMIEGEQLPMAEGQMLSFDVLLHSLLHIIITQLIVMNNSGFGKQ